MLPVLGKAGGNPGEQLLCLGELHPAGGGPALAIPRRESSQ